MPLAGTLSYTSDPPFFPLDGREKPVYSLFFADELPLSTCKTCTVDEAFDPSVSPL